MIVYSGDRQSNHWFLFACLFLARQLPQWVRASSISRFLDHTQRRTTVGRTPLDLYPTIHNNHNRQTSMPPVGFEPIISAGDRPQTDALDRAATGTGNHWVLKGSKSTTTLRLFRNVFVTAEIRGLEL